MRCQFIIPATVFATGKTRPEHRCRFRARQNGFCIRHNPRRLKQTLQTKIAVLQSELAELERKYPAPLQTALAELERMYPTT